MAVFAKCHTNKQSCHDSDQQKQKYRRQYLQNDRYFGSVHITKAILRILDKLKYHCHQCRRSEQQKAPLFQSNCCQKSDNWQNDYDLRKIIIHKKLHIFPQCRNGKNHQIQHIHNFLKPFFHSSKFLSFVLCKSYYTLSDSICASGKDVLTIPP